jgi:hypothetical protein
MYSYNLKRPCINIINTYLQNNCSPNNLKIDRYIQKIDDFFYKTKPIDHEIYLYKNLDLVYDKNKHKSQLFSYTGLYKGFLLANLHQPDNFNNSKENQKMILKINVSTGSKCLLLDDTNILLDRNSIISITSIDKFIINIHYKTL